MDYSQYLGIVEDYEDLRSIAQEMCIERLQTIKGPSDDTQYEIHPYFQSQNVSFNIRWTVGESTESIYDRDIENISISVVDLLKRFNSLRRAKHE